MSFGVISFGIMSFEELSVYHIHKGLFVTDNPLNLKRVSRCVSFVCLSLLKYTYVVPLFSLCYVVLLVMGDFKINCFIKLFHNLETQLLDFTTNW